MTNSCVPQFRECFTDEGVIGAAIEAIGAADPPSGGAATPTLAGVFCVPPAGGAVHNIVNGGLPGPSRVTLRSDMELIY